MGHALTIALHSIDEHHQEEEEEATSITQFNEEVVYSYLFLEHTVRTTPLCRSFSTYC